MKKLMFVLALLVVFAAANSASAETYYVNMAGATAQVGFWKDAADDFLSQAGCATVSEAKEKDDNMIALGESCTNATLGLAGDDVYIRYSGYSSYTGFLGMCGLQSGYCADPNSYPVLKESAAGIADEDNLDVECEYVNGVLDESSCDLECAEINAAVSDVEPNAFVQFTTGYDIKKGDDTDHALPDFATACPALDSTDAKFARPLVVPFAFYVNNTVEKAVCDIDIPAGADMAYDPNGAACDYSIAEAAGDDDICRGYYKCVDGYCQDGVGATACSSTSECPYDPSGNTCVLKPLDNMSRFMAEQIFSGGAQKWSDFGPAYPDMYIKACTRHAGSGTHATLDLQVMRGDKSLKEDAVLNLSYWNAGYYELEALDIYAYVQSTSSSSLIACVADVPYAVGYADTDKLYGKSGNAHIMEYQGVYPTAESIKNGTYNFWAAQVMGYLGSRICGSAGDFTCQEAKIFDGLVAFIDTPGNLGKYLPKKADFWVIQDDMNVRKTTDFAYPSFK